MSQYKTYTRNAVYMHMYVCVCVCVCVCTIADTDIFAYLSKSIQVFLILLISKEI